MIYVQLFDVTSGARSKHLADKSHEAISKTIYEASFSRSVIEDSVILELLVVPDEVGEDASMSDVISVRPAVALQDYLCCFLKGDELQAFVDSFDLVNEGSDCE
nr:MAG: hypothetical protein [Microvirus sp.]